METIKQSKERIQTEFLENLYTCLSILDESKSQITHSRNISKAIRRLSIIRHYCDIKVLELFKKYCKSTIIAYVIDDLINCSYDKSIFINRKVNNNNIEDVTVKVKSNLTTDKTEVDKMDDVTQSDAMEEVISDERKIYNKIEAILASNNSILMTKYITLLLGNYLINYLLYCTNSDIDVYQKLVLKHGQSMSDLIIELVENREFMHDLLDSKLYFILSRISYVLNKLNQLVIILAKHYKFRTSLNHSLCVCTIINQTIYAYLYESQYDKAIEYLNASTFPESIRSTPQVCRYLFYIGKIHCITGNYREAYHKINSALMKLPNDSRFIGFKYQAKVFSILSDLLLGNIPPITEFQNEQFRQYLKPYFVIAQCVNKRDLVKYYETLDKYKVYFEQDGTVLLLSRLYLTIIRSILIKINVAYKRIELKEVMSQLSLPSIQDTECIIMQAIEDQVIDATIDYENSALVSKANEKHKADAAFSMNLIEKINRCKTLNSLAVKSVQYPESENLQAKLVALERQRNTYVDFKSADSELSENEL